MVSQTEALWLTLCTRCTCRYSWLSQWQPEHSTRRRRTWERDIDSSPRRRGSYRTHIQSITRLGLYKICRIFFVAQFRVVAALTSDRTWSEVASWGYGATSEQHRPGWQTDSTWGKTFADTQPKKMVKEKKEWYWMHITLARTVWQEK